MVHVEELADQLEMFNLFSLQILNLFSLQFFHFFHVENLQISWKCIISMFSSDFSTFDFQVAEFEGRMKKILDLIFCSSTRVFKIAEFL